MSNVAQVATTNEAREESGPLDPQALMELFIWAFVVVVVILNVAFYWWNGRPASSEVLQEAAKDICFRSEAGERLKRGSPLTRGEVGDMRKACKDAEAARVDQAAANQLASTQRAAIGQ
ncbi:MAG: hypothetical protein E6R08_00630 [Nevskiaceae bacterium]|nr:MAG: hypothetical protein E6R08_00630 [Nevskiaceae bacterium]